MNIVVCVKRVPETSEADVSIDQSGKDIDKSGLAFDLNEWDSYAIEEAIRLKEKQGGTVMVLSVGGEESNESLRKCLAMGADDALRLNDPAFSWIGRPCHGKDPSGGHPKNPLRSHSHRRSS